MSLSWIAENPAQWDADKRRVVGSAPSGSFPGLDGTDDGTILGAEWWRVEQDGQVVGYGWMDAAWGWAPVLLAVHPDAQGHGVGAFIVEQLDREAHKRGLRYIFNVIPATHPDRAGVKQWLESQGFEPSPSDETMLRRQVRSA